MVQQFNRVQEVNQMECHLSVAVCFYFDTKEAVTMQQLTYRGYAWDADAQDHEGTSEGFSDAEECGQAAANNLFENYPDTGAKCGKSSQISLVNATSTLYGNLKGKIKGSLKGIRIP